MIFKTEHTFMDAIHGITFIDYAATNAFLAQGKDIEELLPALAVEMPQWDEASHYWQRAMANDPEYKLVSIFGDVFQNPAQGKFAGAATQTPEDALRKIPTLEKFIEIQEMMRVAAAYGIDARHNLAQQGITLMDYSQASMHWMDYQHEKLDENDDTFFHWFSNMHQLYRDRYEQAFAAQYGGMLGNDLTF